MGRYVFQTIERVGTENPFDVDGRIVETYGPRPYSSNFVALVELDGEHSADEQPTTEFSEGIEPSADEPPTCSGKDGDCSRTVEQRNGRCWQHSNE